jgi:hypothetical protein
VVQVVEQLPSKLLGSNPSTTGRKKRKKEGQEEDREGGREKKR